jgi:hypothetical protein
MILHSLRAGFPVITDTGCCPSAARQRRPRPLDDVSLPLRVAGGLKSTDAVSHLSPRVRQAWRDRLIHVRAAV